MLHQQVQPVCQPTNQHGYVISERQRQARFWRRFIKSRTSNATQGSASNWKQQLQSPNRQTFCTPDISWAAARRRLCLATETHVVWPVIHHDCHLSTRLRSALRRPASHAPHSFVTFLGLYGKCVLTNTGTADAFGWCVALPAPPLRPPVPCFRGKGRARMTRAQAKTMFCSGSY
jgi:hypothetical protein